MKVKKLRFEKHRLFACVAAENAASAQECGWKRGLEGFALLQDELFFSIIFKWKEDFSGWFMPFLFRWV